MFADEVDATWSSEDPALAPETLFELRSEFLCRHKKSILRGLSRLMHRALCEVFRLAKQLADQGFSTHTDAAMDLPLRDDDACAGRSGRPGRHMIVDRVQQGPVQIEKDCRVAWIFPGEIFVGGHFFWVSHDRLPNSVGCAFQRACSKKSE